jgi:hypothetical protein
MARERDSYRLQCTGCGATGTAHWSENDGAVYLRRGPETVVEISGKFIRGERVPDGPQSFFGQTLVCAVCGDGVPVESSSTRGKAGEHEWRCD